MAFPLIPIVLGSGLVLFLASRSKSSGTEPLPRVTPPVTPPPPDKKADDGKTTMPTPTDMAVAASQGSSAGAEQGQSDGGNCSASFQPGNFTRTPPGFPAPPGNPDLRSQYATNYSLAYSAKFNDARAAADCAG